MHLALSMYLNCSAVAMPAERLSKTASLRSEHTICLSVGPGTGLISELKWQVQNQMFCAVVSYMHLHADLPESIRVHIAATRLRVNLAV
jgi:hypothetical protein